MTHQDKCRYAERRELESEIARLKRESEIYRSALIQCGASLLMQRLPDINEDWPSHMTRKNIDVVAEHNEFLRRKAIELRSVCDNAAEAALREG